MTATANEFRVMTSGAFTAAHLALIPQLERLTRKKIITASTSIGTPRAIVTKLHNEITRYFTSPEMRKTMTAMGAVIDIKTPDEMRKIIPAEIAKWTQVAIDAGMPRDVK